MANKEIPELTTASLPLDLSETMHLVQGGNSRKVTVGDILGEIKWLSRAVGEPFPIWDHLTGADIPPIDSTNYRFIRLTAGEDGAGEYNEGVLTSESVTGTAPLVVATAVIDDDASPLDGQTVSLINTERRFLRAGDSGTVQDHAMQGHRHGHNLSSSSIFNTNPGTSSAAGGGNSATVLTITGPTTDGANGTPLIDNENRPKNIGVTYFMRIR